MLAVVATLTIDGASAAAFEAMFKDFSQEVLHKEEDGCLLYQLCKERRAGRYTMMELYRNRAAFDAHNRSPHFLAAAKTQAPAFNAGQSATAGQTESP